MHTTLRQSNLTEPDGPIRGTFHPSSGSRGGSIGSVLAKVLAALGAMIVIRNVLGAGRRHGGASRWSRRREAIAAFHRELHASDAAGESAESSA
jgi:hypothetical protein